MSAPRPSIPAAASPVVAVPVDASVGAWDRISSWVSDNKAVVYTIAGVAVVVTGAGVVYYLTSDSVRLLDSVVTPCISTRPRNLVASTGAAPWSFTY